MFKEMLKDVWAFDAEWAPDPEAGRLLYDLPKEMGDAEVMQEMFKRGGATDDNPTPFLKVSLCQLVSVVAIVRRESEGTVNLRISSLPRRGELKAESEVINGFLSGVGKFKPQLVGFNSISSDIKIFLQRAVIKGVQVPEFMKRPEKPWLGADYLSKGSTHHLDLYQILHSWGGRGPSLNEMATLSGIPGKLDCDGQMVFELWLRGEIDEIVAYNECDAFTTYLLWLRCAFVSGFFTEEQYETEQDLVRDLLEREITQGASHLQRFLDRWTHLQSRVTR